MEQQKICPKSVWNDIVMILKRDPATMTKVAKNHCYFKLGLGIYALTQVATMLNQWLTTRASYELMETLGITGVGFTPLDMVKQGVYGFIMGLFMMVVMYFVSTKVFKGKEDVDLKGFMTLYCFIVSPMVLIFIPVAGFLAVLWVIVLFFSMMKHVFGFKIVKTFLVAVVSLIGWAIVAGPLGAAMGVSSGFSTDFSFEL